LAWLLDGKGTLMQAIRLFLSGAAREKLTVEGNPRRYRRWPLRASNLPGPLSLRHSEPTPSFPLF